MFIYLIFTICILLLNFSKDKQKALITSLVILFFILGFQYQLTQDWEGNVMRWDIVNNGLSAQSHRELEGAYVWILKICNPLSMFGFFALCVGIQLLLIFIFLKKYIPSQYWWVSLSIFLLNPSMCFMMVNSNRQFLSIACALIMILCLIEKPDLGINLKSFFSLVIVISFFAIGINIHTGMYGACLIIIIPLLLQLIKHVPTKILLLIANILFFARFLYNFSNADIFLSYVDTDSIDPFLHYSEEMDNTNRSFSLLNEIISLLILNGCVYYLKKVNYSTQFFFCMTVISVISEGFVIHTLARVFLYYSYILMFSVPLLIDELENPILKEQPYSTTKELHKRIYSIKYYNLKMKLYTIRIPIYFICFLYLIFSFMKYTIIGTVPYYLKWMDYQSVLSAPCWQ